MVAPGIFEHLQLGLMYETPEGRILAANPAVVKMLDYESEGALKAVNANALYVDRAARELLVNEVLTTSNASSVPFQWQRRDGSRIVVNVSTHAVRDKLGAPIVFESVVEDITARVELEERLRQSHRMEAVGRLAGGVAHDFNNLLTVINGYAELALEQCDTPDVVGQIEGIRKAADSAAGLIRQLLAFSRRQILEPVVVDVNAAVTQITSMLRRLVGEDVRIVTNLCEHTAAVTVDRAQLSQVFVNLAVNARQAMPHGGRLTITVRTTGTHVRIDVADTGVGIEPRLLPHIFEPFFTTKTVGEGTGLGLATVFGFVTQSGGTINVHSNIGEGTTFTLMLPLTPVAAATSATVPVRACSRGHETVLVIEDEPVVGDVIRTMLENDGYTIVLANTGHRAIEWARRSGSQFDLVISDIVLPDMSGPEVIAALRRERPGMKVLFMSGYAARPNGQTFEGLAEPLLQKPFSHAQLSTAIRRALETQASQRQTWPAVPSRRRAASHWSAGIRA